MRTLAILALASIILSASHAAQSTRLRELRGMLPPDVDRVHQIALSDLDGDGDLDAALALTFGPNLVYRNDGTGVFQEATTLDTGAYTYAVEAVDVDGDGDADFVVGNFDLCSLGCTAQAQLFLNDGAGGFVDATDQLPAADDIVRDIAGGDVDGDGDLDLLLGQALECFSPLGICYGGQSRLYLNDGTGAFADAPLQVPVDVEDTQAVALADLDGDGDLDAVLASDPETEFPGASTGLDRLWRNDGSGAFTEDLAAIPAGVNSTKAVALADVDADGDLDLVTTGFPTDALYLNDGTGGFVDATGQLPPSGSKTYSVAAGDVDGDGDEDLFLGNIGVAGTVQNELYLNDGAGLFADATSQLPADGDQTYAVALGDVDGDGDLDSLFGSYNNHQTRLYLNDGRGVFADVSNPLPADNDYSLAAATDVDGDGDTDVLVLDLGPSDPAQNRLLLNDGTGGFVEAPDKLPWDDTREDDAEFVDVDGDGDQDALLVGSPSDFLLLNDGTGTFAEAPGALPSAWHRSVSTGDVDGDGDADALLHFYYGLDLYENDGLGVFSDAMLDIDAVQYPRAAELADLDGDGDLDALVIDQDSFALFNDGLGVFTADLAAVPQFGGGLLELADLDGDGDVDAVSDAWLDVAVALNDGTGVFTVATAGLPDLENHVEDLEVADFDGDGNLDLFVANSSSIDVVTGFERQNRLYLGDGTGGFLAAPDALPLLKDPTWDVLSADFDGDGDVDAFVAGPGQERVYLNLARQLARRALPRVGKPLVLDLHGQTGAPWLLLAATGRRSAILRPFGTFQLDPSTTVLAGLGLLGPDGAASASFAVPAQPGLAGRTLYWQAWIGAGLSNLEITTFTGF